MLLAYEQPSKGDKWINVNAEKKRNKNWKGSKEALQEKRFSSPDRKLYFAGQTKDIITQCTAVRLQQK